MFVSEFATRTCLYHLCSYAHMEAGEMISYSYKQLEQ